MHLDEGTGLRKNAVMIISGQAVFGQETQKRFEEAFQKRSGNSDDEIMRIMTGAQFHNSRGSTYESRMLFTILPKRLYTGKFKPIFAAFLQRIATECKRLLNEGILFRGVRYFPVCLGCKADAPQHVKTAGLTRSFMNLSLAKGCCWECLAGEPGFPFEDCTREPAWVSTIGSELPWDEPGPLTEIPSYPFHPERFYLRDPFHTFKQSLGGHFVASAIVLLGDFGYWPAAGQSNSVDAKLERAHCDFAFYMAREWTGRQVAHMKHFTKGLFHYPNVQSYPYGRFKGADCMLLIRWLRHMLSRGVFLETQPHGRQCKSPLAEPLEPWHQPFLKNIAEACTASLRFFQLMHNSGIWLERASASEMAESCYRFNQAYGQLAKLSHSRGMARFHLEPCQHAYHHFFVEISQMLKTNCTVIPNPALANCEADEDFIGRIARSSRSTHARTVSLRTLERYLLKLRSVWEGW